MARCMALPVWVRNFRPLLRGTPLTVFQVCGSLDILPKASMLPAMRLVLTRSPLQQRVTDHLVSQWDQTKETFTSEARSGFGSPVVSQSSF